MNRAKKRAMLTTRELEELDQEIRAVACRECEKAGRCVLSLLDDCPITIHLPGLVEIVSETESDRMDVYVEKVRERVCTTCRSAELGPGECDHRDAGRCSLDAMLLPIVTMIEGYLLRRQERLQRS